MTISRCLDQALQIGRLPRREWAEQIEKISTVCPHSDCTKSNCQEVCRDWLRMQWRIQVRGEMRGKHG